MLVRFWGVRGSTPTPQRSHLRYGGNTPCLEVRTRYGLFVFDCGSGLRLLGHALRKEFGRRRIRARVFLSHYHWDHIQGIPFFSPLYAKENHFLFHSFRSEETSVRRALEEQMTDPYFPVNMSVMQAHRRFHEIGEGRHAYDGLVIHTRRLNHPQGCLGFRVEYKKRVFVYATDNEPGDPEGDRNVRWLAQDADALVYDAQYTPEEYETSRKTWGHSHWKEGVAIARECRVKKLILFHHDPDHNDRDVDSILRHAKRHFRATVAAREGLTINL